MDFVKHLVTTVLLGFAAGFGAGFIIDKIAKLVLFFLLAIALAVGYAVYAGSINPSWFSVLTMPEFSLPNPSGFNVIVDLFLSHLPFGIGAIVGFFFGLGMRPK
jgi:uncharacterized membrane protein (Fun14 family)